MKRILTALLPLLLAVTACELPEDNFYIDNIEDYLTYEDGNLKSDSGIVFVVTSDHTDGNWKTPGGRIYALFDVLNSKLEINLSSYAKCIIQDPVPGIDESLEPKDPVQILDCGIGGRGHLNVIYTYYSVDGTECPHDITLGWDLNNTTLRLQLIHEGNGENPALMDEESLVQHTKVYSFYIGNLVPEGESRLVTLTADVLEKNDEGAYVVKRSTAAVYNSMVQF